MNREEAIQIVKDMLLICQKLRSNMSETIEMMDRDMSREAAEYVSEDLYPYLHGRKNIVPLLIDITMGTKPLNGLGLYNLMFIAHRLCEPISIIAPLLLPDRRELPEPDISWVTQDFQ